MLLSTPVRVIDVATTIGAGLAKATLAAVVSFTDPDSGERSEQTLDTTALLPEDGEIAVRLLTSRDPESLDLMRHSAAHVMARAVMRLFPNTQLAFGPTTENGFYYDFLTETPISEADFPGIEEEMRKIIRAAEPFERVDEPHDRAMEILAGIGQTLKVDHLREGLGKNETVSFYKQGEFLDLCRGPHIPSAKAIGAVKILSIAGAYWKGDANNPQLQRLYGTAFFRKEELDAYLKQLEEAKRRDHRILGRQHELFAIDNQVGQGLILWLPKGTIVRRQLEAFLTEELTKRGYQQVMTPHIGRIELYQTSGHYPYYAESQFPPIDMGEHPSERARIAAVQTAHPDDASAVEAAKATVEKFLLRPMNCPHHIRIYEVKPRSYRDLPLRISEFGTVYRFEQSGELSGMVRVRGFTQDDAHIFCTPEQVAQEVRGCIEMTIHVLKTLGFDDYRVRLSFRDPSNQEKYVGDPAAWDAAEAAIEQVTREMDLPDVSIGLGEA
ncbi:MAG: threonine--tRNA ligase, partial [Planctomycetia bacterium]|nr:threonine--tRNA ligase [Planctomycetia bacterium]